MGVLDQINQMKSQGISDSEISAKLQEQGINPKSINDAFNQIKIKNAVSAENFYESPQQNSQNLPVPKPISSQRQQFYTPRTQDIEENENSQNPEEFYSPNPEQPTFSGQVPEMENYQQEYYPQQNSYGDYDVYSPNAKMDTDSVIEIAEQVIEEKTKKMQKQIDALNEFASLAQNKIAINHERIKKIENMMDKLQIAILEKVGEYGQGISSVKKELEMMQESFSKTLPNFNGPEKGKKTSKKN